MPIPYIPSDVTMDQQEYEREKEYHIRLLTDSVLPQLIKIAKTRVSVAVRRRDISLNADGKDTVSGLSVDDLAERYALDSCRRFIQLFMALPMKMANAIEEKNDRVLYLSVAADDGSTIPHDMIMQLSMIPNVYEYLGAANPDDARDVLNVSILETLDKYVAQQFRGAVVYWEVATEEMIDDDVPPPSGNMMFSVPWDFTREEVIMTFENMRDARR